LLSCRSPVDANIQLLFERRELYTPLNPFDIQLDSFFWCAHLQRRISAANRGPHLLCRKSGNGWARFRIFEELLEVLGRAVRILCHGSSWAAAAER
jgi:hypothetical protein